MLRFRLLFLFPASLLLFLFFLLAVEIEFLLDICRLRNTRSEYLQGFGGPPRYQWRRRVFRINELRAGRSDEIPRFHLQSPLKWTVRRIS